MENSSLQGVINYTFKKEKLLYTALTHSSYANEITGDPTNGNERLEFLGDAILDAVVSDFLFARFPEKEEGELTKLRAQIVCEKSLGHVGKSRGLNAFIRLGKGEELGGGRERLSIIADALEALIGAVFIDGGFENAKNVVSLLFADVMEDVLSGHFAEDYKTSLQELLQRDGEKDLRYCVISEEGPDHAKTFTTAVSYDRVRIGIGRGTNKKEAEQDAARDALINMQAKR